MINVVDNQPELKIMHPVKATAFERTTIVGLSGIQHIVALNAQGTNSTSF